jgi:hypothetical protein
LPDASSSSTHLCASSPCSLGSFKCPLCVHVAWACCVQHQQNCTHPYIHPLSNGPQLTHHPSSSLSYFIQKPSPSPIHFIQIYKLVHCPSLLHTYLFIHLHHFLLRCIIKSLSFSFLCAQIFDDVNCKQQSFTKYAGNRH